ncbi:MAG: L,D-transpeptidase [Actinomycetota bacterium]
MRHDRLRVSWLATMLAGALVLGSPLVSGAAGDDAPDRTPAGIVRTDPSVDPSFLRVAVRARGSAVDVVEAPSRPEPAQPSSQVLVRVPRDLALRAKPHVGARVVGTMPSGSKYYDVPVTAWVEKLSSDGRWGRVEIPYVWPRRHGWLALRGLPRQTTNIEVRVDLSEHRITVSKFGRALFGMPAATGSPTSPTPTGEYFVTDRIPFSGGYLGTFAFGISGIQPRLPAGWSGGNQLAIHGTNDPASIGRSASAGCLRVSERSLDRLEPLLRLGTPVIVVR